MVRFRLLSLLLSSVAAMVSFAEGPSVVDSMGRTITLESGAKRVVSLSPAATEILFAIGAGERTVGVTKYCDYPEEAKTRQKVGGFSGATVSVESIVALQPDLVLVSGGMHEKIASLLDEVGIRSFTLEPKSFEDVYAEIIDVGKLTDCSEGAIRVVSSMRSRVSAVVASVSGKNRPSVFWELWDDPLMTAGGDTFVSEAIRLAGGRNIFADLSEQWPKVSLEELLVRQPQWLLSGDDHGDRVNLTAVTKRPGWENIPAVKSGRIAIVDSDIINRGGPRLADAVEALARILH